MEIPTATLDHSAVHSVEVRNKFIIRKVENEHGLVMIKMPRDPKHREDLRNEADWVKYVGSDIDTDAFSLPTIVDEDPEGKWLMYEWIGGQELDEIELGHSTLRMAQISAAVGHVSLGREGGDVQSWLMGRLNNFANQPALSNLRPDRASALEQLVSGRLVLPKIQSGMGHGDLKPENILTVGNEW